MAVLKGISRSKRLMTLSKGLMIDTVRGVLRVRKWPRKRGTPKSESQLYWIDWFRQANRLAKYVDGATAARAIEITKGSGMYPRDVILSAMRGRLYTWSDQNGKVWHSMAAIQDISDSLDVLAQNIGSVLVRATDRWRAPPPANIGDFLQYQGAAATPEWKPVAGTTRPLACVLATSVNIATVNSVAKVIPWDTETYDDFTGHDPAVNPSRITIPAGATRCRCIFQAHWASHAVNNVLQQRVLLNGAAAVPDTAVRSVTLGAGNSAFFQCKSYDIDVVPGDYLEAEATQFTGVGINILNTALSWFSVEVLS